MAIFYAPHMHLRCDGRSLNLANSNSIMRLSWREKTQEEDQALESSLFLALLAPSARMVKLSYANSSIPNFKRFQKGQGEAAVGFINRNPCVLRYLR